MRARIRWIRMTPRSVSSIPSSSWSSPRKGSRCRSADPTMAVISTKNRSRPRRHSRSAVLACDSGRKMTVAWRKLITPEPSESHRLRALIIIVWRQTEGFRLPSGHFFVDLIEPAAGTTQDLTNKRFRLSGPPNCPLRHILQQVVTLELTRGLDRQLCEFSQASFEDVGHGVTAVGGAGRDILDRAIDFLIVHEHRLPGDFHILFQRC